jgi:futalosine hydrolase
VKGRLLVVTAVAAERAACPAAPGMDVIVAGVGPVAAAAATAAALAGQPYDAVLSAGIAGGFPPVTLGEVVVADAVIFADLGAETADGFTPVSQLGIADERGAVDAALATQLAARTGGRLGTVLTVATGSGTAATAAARRARHPRAVAEAMEGAGVAEAAWRAGVRFGELRAISNLVGPRDRAGWRIPQALDALETAIRALAGADWTA